MRLFLARGLPVLPAIAGRGHRTVAGDSRNPSITSPFCGVLQKRHCYLSNPSPRGH
jgi:hypothetical protein